MRPIFQPPISTSNLYAPEFQSVWEPFCGLGSNGTDRDSSSDLTEKLEQQLCDYHDSDYCVSFSTGFWALVAATRIRAISERTEVIIPSLTYRRLADVVYWAGFTPLLVDVEPDNLSICPQAVEDQITGQTAMILAVHPIVNCCNVRRLIEIAESHRVPIVFDAVESVHETHHGRRIGSFGVGEVFSLHASKLINGLEGGYVCTNDKEFCADLRAFRRPWQDPVGLAMETSESLVRLPSALNDMHAAFAIASLSEIEMNVRHNEENYQTYIREFETIPNLQIHRFECIEQTSFKNIVARVESSFPMTRDELVNNLNQLGILARSYYSPALHQKEHRFDIKTGPLETTERCMGTHINLPCGSRVVPKDIKKVCQHIRQLAVAGV